MKGIENLFQEIMTENIPNMGKDWVIQVHEANRSPQNVNPKCSSLRHRVIKLSKNKQITTTTTTRIFTAARGKKNGFTQGNPPIKLPVDVSAETFQARGQ